MPQIEDLSADAEADQEVMEKIGGAEPPRDLITEADMSLPFDPLRSLGMPDDEEEDDEVCAEDLDETLGERLKGLGEMFPDAVRSVTGGALGFSVDATKWLYNTGRVVMWVVASSAVLLALPVMFETERAQVEEQQMQQQRQLLLGPNAAVSGAGQGLMPGALPQIAPVPSR